MSKASKKKHLIVLLFSVVSLLPALSAALFSFLEKYSIKHQGNQNIKQSRRAIFYKTSFVIVWDVFRNLLR